LSNGDSYYCRMPNLVAAETLKQSITELVANKYITGVYVVKVSSPYDRPTPDLPQPPGTKWCPYCGSFRRRFRWNRYTLCEICFASNECFEFKQANNEWIKRERKIYLRKAKKKGGVDEYELKMRQQKLRRIERRKRRKLMKKGVR